MAIPALAGLSVLHGLVPPHPGPLAAVSALDADLGLTLLFGLILAVPTVIVAGPVFASWVSRYVVAQAPPELVPAGGIAGSGGFPGEEGSHGERTSSAGSSGAGSSGAASSGGASRVTVDAPETHADTEATRGGRAGDPDPGTEGPATSATTRGEAGAYPAAASSGTRGEEGTDPTATSSAPDGEERPGVTGTPLTPGGEGRAEVTGTSAITRRPAFWPAVATILLPVVLMLARAIGELVLDEGDSVRNALEVAGEPLVALLVGVLVAMFTLGFATGMDRTQVSSSVAGALPSISAILLIVAAGGGFKQVLVDAGIGQVIADAARDADLSPLLLGWLVAVGIRVATGSATVATITAAGIVAPLAADQSTAEVSLLVLAIGAGSLFFSHVNDAGFWLVKEYLGLTVGQTLRTWSVMETLISVMGLAGVLGIALLV